MFDVAPGQLGGGGAAAIAADGAIDLVLNALGDAAQDAVAVVARFHEAAEAEVFVALLLAEHLDLHQVRDHCGGSSSPSAPVGWAITTGRGAMARTRPGRS